MTSPMLLEPIRSLVSEIELWDPRSHAQQDFEFDYIDIGSVDRDAKCLNGLSRVPAGEAPSRARQRVQAHDVLVSTVRPNLNAVAVVPTGLQSPTASTGFCVLRAREKRLDPQYLYYWVRTPQFIDTMTRLATGASYPAVSDRTVMDSRIPVPKNIEEQRRIADILDDVDSLRRKRAKAIRLANDLVPSLFYEMFGDPVSKPKEKWKPKPLSQLVRDGTDVTYGIVQCGPHVADGVPYVRTSDMTADHLDVSQMGRTATEIATRFTRSRVEKGELVISIRASVGTVHLVPPELDGGNLTQGTARISPGPDANNLWLLWALRSSGAQRWLTQQCKGTTFREITLGRLRELPLATPPRRLQDDFGDLALAASDTLAQAKQSEAELDNLFHSLLQRAFRGEL